MGDLNFRLHGDISVQGVVETVKCGDIKSLWQHDEVGTAADVSN